MEEDFEETSGNEHERETSYHNETEEQITSQGQAQSNVFYEPSPEEKEAEAEERANENNANVVSNAADVAIATGNPYAMAIGAAIKVADSKTGGKCSQVLGKATTIANKLSSASGSMENNNLQKGLNFLSESGAADKIGTAASIYNMGKGGAGAASKAADGASKAAEAASAAEKASEAANAAEKASKASEAASKAGDGAKAMEEAQKASEAANQAENASNEYANRMEQKREAQEKFEASQKAALQNKQTNKNPYETKKPKDERNLDEIIDDKIEEKKAEGQTDPNEKQYEQEEPKKQDAAGKVLEFALDIVDTALDVVNSLTTKIKKLVKFLIIGVPLIPLFAFIILFIILATAFGADISIGGNYPSENPPVEEEEYTGNVILKYSDDVSVTIDEGELLNGVTFLFLKDDIDTYYEEGLNMETIYAVYGILNAIKLYEGTTDETEIYNVDYSNMPYCDTDGCYQVEIDGNKVYVDEELSKNYSILDTILQLEEDRKNELESNVSEGALIAGFLRNSDSKGIKMDENLKTKIHDYVKDGLDYETILDKLGIKYDKEIEEPED